MTEDKLTLADCFKYYNSRLIEKDGFKFNNIAEFLGCKFDSLDNYQLELRSIEQLTDEEEQYIVKNFVFVSWNVFEKLTELNLTVLMGYCWFLKLKDLFDYLREKNIMIEKPDWFEIGKAVKG